MQTNSPTVPTTIAEIMTDPKFELGVADVRAGRERHSRYENWPGDEQWNYERGRAWANLVPRTIALKRAGKVTAEAIAWFGRVDRFIL
jgi:hypothetical protein